jgi:hypothetical protein
MLVVMVVCCFVSLVDRALNCVLDDPTNDLLSLVLRYLMAESESDTSTNDLHVPFETDHTISPCTWFMGLLSANPVALTPGLITCLTLHPSVHVTPTWMPT